MDNRIFVNRPIQPLKPGENQTNKNVKKTDSDQPSFKQLLNDKLQKNTEIKFSKHAQQRIETRGIKVNEQDLKLLNNGFQKAEEKGSRDSLIMVNKVAYVVSVENKTVITAIDDKNIKENVFTNIDSAVFM